MITTVRRGELNVCFPKRFQTPYSEAFVNACVERGFVRNPDYNGARQAGAGLFQFTIRNGRRHSGATAFLNPVKKRSNLTILTRTQVTRIILEKGRAVGVEARTKNGETVTFRAGQEVLLSAGAFASPQILMLSGIGEREQLQKYGIDCLHELPGVGKNLQDHLFFNISALSKQQQGQNHHIHPFHQMVDFLQYLLFKKGALTISPLEAVAFGSTTASPERVDIQYHFASFQMGADGKTSLYRLKSFSYEDGVSILPTLLRPKSRGKVSLRSADPFEYPAIQPNFLEAEADRRVLLEGARKALEILEAKAFDPFRKQIIGLKPGDSDDVLFLHIQKFLETVYHPVGTCKMGQDEMAVVDAQLRVHGIEGLRVVDASIMPVIVSGNTNAPVYMIAERAADLVTAINR